MRLLPTCTATTRLWRRPLPIRETDALSAVYRPECGGAAWVEWRDVAGGTARGVVYVKVRCFARHWFLLPEDRLTGRSVL